MKTGFLAFCVCARIEEKKLHFYYDVAISV